MIKLNRAKALVSIIGIIVIVNMLLVLSDAETSDIEPKTKSDIFSVVELQGYDSFNSTVAPNSNTIRLSLKPQIALSERNDKKIDGVIATEALDKLSIVIICIMLAFCIAVIIIIAQCIVEISKNKYKIAVSIKQVIRIIFLTFVFIIMTGFSLLFVPEVLLNGATWNDVCVLGYNSFLIALFLVFTSCILFCVYANILLLYKNIRRKAYFALVIIGIVSGFVNAFILFTINEAISGRSYSSIGLYVFFTMGLLLYTYCYRYLRTKLIIMSNDLVYDKRMELINKVLSAPYFRFENTDKGKLFATLTNDMAVLNNTINILIGAVTNIVTLLCCFVYLGLINLVGLFASVALILIGGLIYYLISIKAKKYMEENMKTQNQFYNIIKSMIDGIKELNISLKKRNEFKNDMQESCETFREVNVISSIKFANAFIVGDLLTFFVIGGVAFIFPIVFKDLSISALRDYIFIYLYMTGPVRYILNLAPELFNIKFSWDRINDVLDSMSDIRTINKNKDALVLDAMQDEICLKLEEVCFDYKVENETVFSVGPINYEFKSGEVIFISGGNGSGKSTLAKILTGLYTPGRGVISINGKEVCPKMLGESFSTVYSDFFLFDKLYGIDYENKQQEIDEYLKLFRLNNKVAVENGEFTTTKLSTGQRKRLALLLSYLEDKPICLFDEWAADQDPEFRRYFYLTLLPELKARGKCIIAISHDDSYYYVADKLIKMELGKIAEATEQATACILNVEGA